MKVLVFQHEPREHPGRITGYAQNNNIKLDVIEFWKPYSIPSVLDYDALIIMGGSTHVYDDSSKYPSKENELRVIREGAGKISMIGFCLGAELLAAALGANVHPNGKNGKIVKEIGYSKIDLTNEGKQSPIFNGFNSPIEVLELHGDAFDLPENATLLATSPLCTNQVFSYKNIYGFICHFEITSEMLADLIENHREWLHKDNELNEAKFLQQAQEKTELMNQQSERLLQNFFGTIQEK